MTKKRVLSGALAIAFAVVAVLNTWVGLLAITGLTIGGLYELFYLMKKKGVPIYSYTGIAFGAAIQIYTFFRPAHMLDDNFLFVFLGMLFIFVLQFIRQNTKDAVIGMSTTLFGILYVGWLLSFLTKIRFLLPGIQGAELLAFVILITKVSDVGALIIGQRFGKHRLLEKVSPNKTIEGSLGGVLFSAVTAVLCQGFLPEELNLSILHLVAMGVVFSLIGQFGDLAESIIKRDCQVKDSGKMLPEIGGVLDTIDSLLFSAPLFYFYMTQVMDKV